MTKMIVMTSFLTLSLSLAACGKDAAGAAGGKLGVAECDAYFETMDACAKKKGGPTGTSMPGVCTSAIEDMKKQVPDGDW